MSIEVIIDIAKDANPVIKVIGAKGPECKALTKDLEKALGKVESSVPTKEMTEVQTNVRRVNQ